MVIDAAGGVQRWVTKGVQDDV